VLPVAVMLLSLMIFLLPYSYELVLNYLIVKYCKQNTVCTADVFVLKYVYFRCLKSNECGCQMTFWLGM